MGIIDMITGQNPNQGNIDQAQNAANAAQANNSAIDQQLAGQWGQLFNTFQNQYMPQIGPLSNAMTGLQGPMNMAGPMQANMMQALSNPMNSANATGINLAGGGPSLWNQFQGVGNQGMNAFLPGGQINSFWGNQMQNGLDPAVAGNAMGRLNSQLGSNVATLADQFGAATPNKAGLIEDLNANSAEQMANLQSSLVAQDQGLRMQGAQGLGASLGAGFGMAGNMLNAGAGLQGNILSNMNAGAEMPFQDLGVMQNFISQGLGAAGAAGSGLGSVGAQYGNQASNFGNLAQQFANSGQQQNAQTGQFLGGIAGMLPFNGGRFSAPSYAGQAGIFNPNQMVNPASGLPGGAW